MCFWASVRHDFVCHSIKHLEVRIRRGDWASVECQSERGPLLLLTRTPRADSTVDRSCQTSEPARGPGSWAIATRVRDYFLEFLLVGVECGKQFDTFALNRLCSLSTGRQTLLLGQDDIPQSFLAFVRS